MLRLVLDCETNGLLHELDVVHSLVLRDVTTGEVHSCADQPGYKPIMYGLELMKQADQLIGHNTIAFDFRALAKVYPGLRLKPDCDIVDTLIMSRVLWPELEPLGQPEVRLHRT